jgi:hypothetical protein
VRQVFEADPVPSATLASNPIGIDLEGQRGERARPGLVAEVDWCTGSRHSLPTATLRQALFGVTP